MDKINFDSKDLENLEGEIWNDVYGFDGIFSVSNYGRVKREERYTENGNKLKEKILARIYMTNKSSGKRSAAVNLNYNSNRFKRMVSQLVVESFFRPLEGKECAIHLDKNRTFDDRLQNLKIGSYSESIKNDFIQNSKSPKKGDEGITGRNKKIEQLDLNGNVIAEFISLGAIERDLGFKKQAISALCKGDFTNRRPFYQAYGYKWRYKA